MNKDITLGKKNVKKLLQETKVLRHFTSSICACVPRSMDVQKISF